MQPVYPLPGPGGAAKSRMKEGFIWKCVCDCRQAGDSFRSCYYENPLAKAYLPDERLLRRSGRTWPHVEAVPLHSGTADACDYDKCS